MNVKDIVEQQYTSAIKFNREITGREPLPRSTNIKEIRRAGDNREYGLYVEFWGYQRKNGAVSDPVGYIYKTNDHNIWLALVQGAEAGDLSDDPNRRSTGRAFSELVKSAGIEFEKVVSPGFDGWVR